MIKTVRASIEAIDEDAWQRIEYPDDGEAQIAETVYAGRRVIVRRTRLVGAQAQLWPDWRHFCLAHQPHHQARRGRTPRARRRRASHRRAQLGAKELRRVLRPGGRAIFIENAGDNAVLTFARDRLAGRWGIPRLGTDDEHPLTADDINTLRGVFGRATAHYPVFEFLVLFDRQVLRFRSPRVSRIIRKVDNATHRLVQQLRRFSIGSSSNSRSFPREDITQERRSALPLNLLIKDRQLNRHHRLSVQQIGRADLRHERAQRFDVGLAPRGVTRQAPDPVAAEVVGERELSGYDR